MFEKFAVPLFYIEDQCLLSLLSKGIGTGFVLETGGGITQMACIDEGQKLPFERDLIAYAGRDLTEYISEHITLDYNFDSFTRRTISKNIKEKLCSIPISFETATRAKETYELPDGRSLEIPKEVLLKCSQSLFRNDVLENYFPFEIPEKIFEIINKLSIPNYKDLSKYIIISGGNSCFEGFDKRLIQELQSLGLNMNSKTFEIPRDQRRISCWIGGTMKARQLFKKEFQWLSKEEYEESGPCVVCRKCF